MIAPSIMPIAHLAPIVPVVPIMPLVPSNHTIQTQNAGAANLLSLESAVQDIHSIENDVCIGTVDPEILEKISVPEQDYLTQTILHLSITRLRMPHQPNPIVTPTILA